MKRVYLEDSSKWFDAEAAQMFKEDTWHNGSNFISKATGSQWEHQSLYLTASQKFIIHAWSDFQGKPEIYKEVSNEYAAEWFVKNEYQNEDIPEFLHELITNLELK
jgi:hypothetical protein